LRSTQEGTKKKKKSQAAPYPVLLLALNKAATDGNLGWRKKKKTGTPKDEE